jgi:hypothetical protein
MRDLGKRKWYSKKSTEKRGHFFKDQKPHNMVRVTTATKIARSKVNMILTW